MVAATQLIYFAPNVLILRFYFILRLSLRVLFSKGNCSFVLWLRGITTPMLSFKDISYQNPAQVHA